MPDVAINAQQVVSAGQGYTVPESLALLLKNVRASYNGTGAAGAFVPVLRVVSDAGLTVGEYRLSGSIAAGASADVTWFPGAVEDGIDFNTYPQGGQWLYAETDGPGIPPGFVPFGRYPASVGELTLLSHGSKGMFLYEDSGGGIVIGTEQLPTLPAPSYTIGGGGVQIFEGYGGIGLFGKTSGSWSQDGSLFFFSGSNLTAQGTATVALIAPTVTMTLSQLAIVSLPTSDPGVSGRIWADNGVLVYSGHTAGGGGITFGTNTGNDLLVITTNGGVEFQLAATWDFTVFDSNGNPLIEQIEDGSLTVNLVAGQASIVKDSGGNPIFEVRDDGSIHGLAATGAITWDL